MQYAVYRAHIIDKSFRGHAGRPGQVGGSLPKGAEGHEGHVGGFRGPAVSAPGTYYHGTVSEVLAGILKDGIAPQHEHNFPSHFFYTRERTRSVFVTDNLSRAKHYADTAVEHVVTDKHVAAHSVIFKVHLDKSELKADKLDPMSSMHPGRILPAQIVGYSHDGGNTWSAAKAVSGDVYYVPVIIVTDATVGKIGTAASGNYGHQGRVGEVGGSIAQGQMHAMSSPLDVSKEEIAALDEHNDRLNSECQYDRTSLKAIGQADIVKKIEDDPGMQAKFDSFALGFADWTLGQTEAEARLPELRAQAVRNLVDSWAISSGDNNRNAIALQIAAREEFGFGGVVDHYRDQSTVRDAQRYYERHADGLRTFLRAQYELTQERLAKNGIKELVLCRGVGESGALYGSVAEDRGHRPRIVGEKTVSMAPMSSFTWEVSTALDFAKSGNSMHPTILYARVPAERVLSYPRTGFGCRTEFEVVVLGGHSDKLLSVPYQGHDQTEQHLMYKQSLYPQLSKELSFVREHRNDIGTPRLGAVSATKSRVNIDANLEESDWPKRSWDLSCKPGTPEFDHFLLQQGLALEELKNLPVYRAYVQNVQKIGTPHSGNYGHASVLRHRGGSAPGEGGQMHATKVVGGKRMMADGSPLPAHIASLYIPPGWHSVIINPDPHADLLVMGKDAKDRDQPLYAERFREGRKEIKHQRVAKMFEVIDKIQQQNKVNRHSTDKRIRDHADCLHLVAEMGLRPGSEKDTRAAKKAYGATTLEGRHVVQKGDAVHLQFVGKKGVDQDLTVETKGTGDMLVRRAKKSGPTKQIFPRVSEDSLLRYSKELSHGAFLTKDFRGYVANKTAMIAISKLPRPKTMKDYKASVRVVAKLVSSKLGNTPAIALQSYINPVVFAKWRSRLKK